MLKQSLSVLSATLFLTSISFADVTIESFTKSGGFQGFGAAEITQTQYVSGLESRNKTKTKYKSQMMRLAGGGGNQDQITDVKKGHYININNKKKTYTIVPIKPISEMGPFGGGGLGQPTSPKGKPEKETHRIKKSSYDAKKTGNEKKVAGLNTFEVLTTAKIQMEEIETKLVTTFRMEVRSWIAKWTPELRKAAKEHANFSAALMKKLGLKISPEDFKALGGSSVGMMLGMGGKGSADIIKKVKAKAKLFDGYPMATASKWYMDEDPKIKAKKEAAMKKAEKESEKNPEVDYSGGAKGLAGSILGGFAKKKMEKRSLKKQKAKAGAAMLDTYHEVKAINFGKIPGRTFEVNKKYKEVKAQEMPDWSEIQKKMKGQKPN